MQAVLSKGASMSIQVTGKAKGGFARAEILSPEKRREIAQHAAAARWDKKAIEESQMPHVLEGFKSILNIAGTKLPCAVIQDSKGIRRVLSENGITEAILGTRSGASKRLKKAAEGDGARLPLFVAPGKLKPFITQELLDGPLKAIDYLDGDRTVRGYDASVLGTVCDIWLQARAAGALQAQQLPKAQKAEVLARALMQTGIVALVDEATGYQSIRPKDALQAYLEKLIAKELAAWAKKFPDEFYENIYRLKGWTWPGTSVNRYSVVAHYTNDLVYERLAPGLRKALEEKNPKNEKGWRPAKNHQWLTADIGDPMLAQHLYSLVMFQRLAISSGFGWNRFVKMVDRVHPKKGATLELPFPEEEF
jgi:P63C domain